MEEMLLVVLTDSTVAIGLRVNEDLSTVCNVDIEDTKIFPFNLCQKS